MIKNIKDNFLNIAIFLVVVLLIISIGILIKDKYFSDFSGNMNLDTEVGGSGDNSDKEYEESDGPETDDNIENTGKDDEENDIIDTDENVVSFPYKIKYLNNISNKILVYNTILHWILF